jgi:CheY-like chemotaxis protein
LLAGQWDAMNRRGSLVEHSDDVIFTPFSSRELIFRLCRLMSVQVQNRRTLVRPRKPCVVVADDDRDIIIYLKTVLANMDVDAHFVSDGKAALAAARRLLPNLLMLDVSMPIMNGIEVLRCLRNDPGTSSLRAVLLTASTDPDHVESSIKLGASEYILKPFGHVELTRKLKNMLRNSVVQ